MFASKKELLQSLPAVSASDFIIYDTSAQDETKPYVLVSFSFFDEKVGSYNYQVRINKTLGNFIKEVYRLSGSSGYTGIYMADVRTYYYDTTTSQWILDQINTKRQIATSSIGLKGSIDTIIYSTRDVYPDSGAVRSKDNRFLLSGRFRNESPFDEIFSEGLISSLNYEEGDHLLRLKYADNHHALFVIKQATSPLSITYSSSSTSTYSLTTSGTISGLECKDNTYTTVSSISQIKTNNLSFDDYVLYSTLDIAYENRIMRLKDHYITGTRDEIVAINGLERVQIDIPHEGYEVITNPSGLEVECFTELPDTFTAVDSFVAQFRARNSYAYEHYFETIDELEKWDKFPLPQKQVIADFFDGNDYRIIYQSAADKTCQMLTFSMEEGCDLYWGSNNYAYWYFTDKTKASNFKLYSLSKEGIGEATTVDWQSTSSSYNYLNTTVRAYKRDVECIFFTNTSLLHSDKTTVLVEEMSFDWLSDTYFHFKTIQFNPDARIKVGETWESRVEVVANQSANITYKSLTFEGEYQPTYDKHGSYLITAKLVVDQYPDQIHTSSFLLNIHEDETTFNYPNTLPFPPQDGMESFIVFRGRTGIELLSYTATEGVYAYFSGTNYFNSSYKHGDGGYDTTTGTYFYKLTDANQWELQVSKQIAPQNYPFSGTYLLTDRNDLLFSNTDFYESSSKTEVVYEAKSYPREEYSIKKRPFEPPFELPSVKEIVTEDQAQHYFIMYCKADIYLVTIIPEMLEDFHLYQQGGNSTYLYPSCRMTSVKYRRLNQSTMMWNSPSSYTNQTSFNSSWVYPGYSSTLNGAKTLNDMIIYTTAPVYLKRSAGTAPMTLARLADNQLVVDENSIAPLVTDILFGIEAPFTVDSKFTFDPVYQLEDLEGLMFGGIEWTNKMSYYPSGEHTISVRVKDSRGLWSEWFDKTFTIESVEIPSVIDLTNLPLKTTGEPYQHYLVAKYNGGTTALSYFCFAFDLKADVTSFTPYMRSNNNYFNFNAYAKDLFETAHYYEGYNQNTGWGSGSYKEITMTYTYLSIGSTYRYVYESLASNVFLSTFPIYTDNMSSTIRAFPINQPQFPLTVVAAATHENVWTSDDVKVSYNIVLNGQVLKEAFYRVNGGEPVSLSELSGEITFSQTRDYHVEFVATNNEGNESRSEVFFKIDKTSPVLEISETESELVFAAIDEHAGIDTIYYRLAETNVFTRSQNFAHHLAVALNEADEDEMLAKNAWIKITSGYKLKKPVYGGVYTYELMATDKVGNTHMVQYVYDLPKIPIEQVIVTPSTFDLTYRNYQQLTVQVLPENHNEELTLTYSTTSPYISVSNKGLVQNIDTYYEGLSEIVVQANELQAIATARSVINRVEYPKSYPSLYDIHHYTHEFTDFLIAKDRYYGYFYLYAFNRKQNDAIFYLTTQNTLFHHLGYSIPNTVTDAKYFAKLNENQWNREGTVIRVAEDMLDEWYLSSKNPHESVVFSTVDLYTDATGERLIRPKDELPPSIKASVRLEPDYFGGWVTASHFKVVGDDLGDGLTKLTYSINGEKEVEIENGGIIYFPSSGVHTVQAFAYNNHNVRSETECLTVEIDFDAPTVSIEKEYNESTACYDLYVVATDTVSTLDLICFHKNGEVFPELYFKGDTETRTLIDSHSIMEYGTFGYDIFVSDVAGNEAYTYYELEVEEPVPSGITVSPASVSIREGEVITLDVQVDIVGDLQEGEITLSGYDDFVIDVNGFEVMGLTSGFTTIIVSCRGVSTSVPVYVSPAFIPVESLDVRPTEATLEVGETIQLETIITPHEATDRTLIFHSTHADIVSVDEEGVVCALTQGQAEVIVSTHNNIEQRVSITVLKQKEAPVVSNLTVQPSSPYVGQKVLFSYDVWLDTERGAKLVEERWTGKQESYQEAGTYTVALEVLDSNGLWSEKIEITFEVRPVSNIRVKLNDGWKSLAVSTQETSIRVKTADGWVSLLLDENSPVRFNMNDEWIGIKIEE